jgi:tight adherence protein C
MIFLNFEIIVPVLVFFSVIAIGASLILSRKHKEKQLELRVLAEDNWVQTEEIVNQQKKDYLSIIEKIGNYVSHGKSTTTLADQLIRAGYFKRSAAGIYTGIKMLFFVAGLVIATVLTWPADLFKITIIIIASIVLFFIPNMIILARYKKRSREISRYLPEAIDLLEICVSSGIGLDMAWNIVSDEIHSVSPMLAGAMALSDFEIHLGADRIEAMRHMAECTGVDDISSLAAILVQTEKFGTSVGTTLQIFANSMREERDFATQENAEKMAVKLIIPMVVFIFPAVLITVVGPAAINLATVVMNS